MCEEYELRMSGICKTFGTLCANDHVELCVKKSSIHAIIGENGAGKSTLMSILSGVQKADRGEIHLRGQQVDIQSPTDAVAHGIGMVYQEFMQFPGLTVLDNIIMGYENARAGRIDRRQAHRRLTEICTQYSFPIPLNSKVDKLPVALLQQVEIVKVLYKNADILIFDEPTSVLTPQGIEGLFTALRGLRDRGKTIIIITHKLKEVLAIADEITVLKDGRVTGRLPAEEADEHLLARLMTGREVVFQVHKPEKEIGGEVLRVEHLTVQDQRGSLRVKDASLTVRAGEIVGICGIAGNGESELIAGIVGMQNTGPQSKIYLENHPVQRESIARRRILGMGYVPQDRNRMGVNREGSIWETAYMGHYIAAGRGRRLRLDRQEAHAFAQQVVDDFSVKAQSIQDRVSSLSGGNVQKLLVGREFSQNYKLIVMEDPTRGIDIGAVEFIWGKILEYAAAGTAILLVSHELNEVMQLSDRILVMHSGELIALEDGPRMSEKEIGMYMLGGMQRETT